MTWSGRWNAGWAQSSVPIARGTCVDNTVGDGLTRMESASPEPTEPEGVVPHFLCQASTTSLGTQLAARLDEEVDVVGGEDGHSSREVGERCVRITNGCVHPVQCGVKSTAESVASLAFADVDDGG